MPTSPITKKLQLFEQVVVNFRKGFQHRVNLPHYAVPCFFKPSLIFTE